MLSSQDDVKALKFCSTPWKAGEVDKVYKMKNFAKWGLKDYRDNDFNTI